MSNNNDTSAEVVFEYTGKGCAVPKDVTIVRFHPSVVEVESHAFEYCKQLREVIFNDGLQKIGSTAFWTCTSLSSITLPSTVTEVERSAFYYCSNLTGIVLNEGLQKIGWSAFDWCTSLSSITIPSTVTEIGSCTFHGCSNLSEAVLNEGLQKIGRSAFCYCSLLSSITFPSTLTEIDYSAFYNCRNLKEVVFHGVPREIEKKAFLNCTSLERFTFPTISSRIDNLIHTGHWEDIENEVNEVRGAVERSGGDLCVSTQTMGGGGGRNWNRVRDDLSKIIRLISYYELNEATSIFELALWKFKLDQVDKANPIPRKKCRLDVPGPVKDIILQYLPHDCLLPVSDIDSESDDEESSDGGVYYESSDDDDY